MAMALLWCFTILRPRDISILRVVVFLCAVTSQKIATCTAHYIRGLVLFSKHLQWQLYLRIFYVFELVLLLTAKDYWK